jgi:CHAT domain-containing protein
MSEAPKSGRGLDPETLAAYVDGRLPPDERERVEAELVRDPESYEWLVQTLRAEEQIEVPKVPRVPKVPTAEVPGVPEVPKVHEVARVLPFRRRAVVGAVGSVLAVAAALLLVVRLQPAWWQAMWGPAIDPRFEKLVTAVGEERYIEGRLTGGFKYGPLRSVTRGPGDLSNQNLALLAAAGELQKAAQANPSAENLHAWGVAQLLLRDYDEAVRTLESASRYQPAPSGYLSDLSAAYVARAEARSLPEDWPRALKAADQSLLVDAKALEPLFNRGLALEGMALKDRAIEAWTSYLSNDSGSGWAVEARRRLRLLKEETPKSENLDLFERGLRLAASTGSIATLTADHSAEAFDWMLRTPIPVCDLKASERIPQQLAMELVRATGDRLFADLVAEAERCEAGWSERWLRTINLLALIDRDETAKAKAALIGTGRHSRWPVQDLVITLATARLMLRERNYRELAAVTDGASRMLATGRYPILFARLLYIQGVSQYVVGRFDESSTDLELAARKFQASNQHADHARTLVDLASLKESEGQLDLAWDRLAEALVVARRVDSRRLRTAAYSTAATLHAYRDNYGAAAAFLISMRESLGPEPSPVVLVVNRVDTAKAYLFLRRFREASLELDAASVLTEKLRSDARYSSLNASIAGARALAAILQQDGTLALGYSDQAIGLTESDRADQRVTYQLLRAQALCLLGRATDAAEEVSRAISSSQQRRKAVGTRARSGLQRLVQDTAQSVAAQLINDGKPFDALQVIQDSQHERLGTLFRHEFPVRRLINRLSSADAPVVVMCLAKVGASIASWSITGKERVFSEVSLDAITEQLQRLNVAVRTQQLEAVQSSLARLDRLLFDPHRQLLDDAARVVVVPDADTMVIPFPALSLQWKRAGREAVALTVAPSLDVVPLTGHRLATPRQVLAIGNESTGYEELSRLPNVLREVRQIASLYERSRVELAPSLSIGALQNLVPHYEIIHIAAHSVVDRHARAVPRMILGTGNSGLLTGRTIRSWRFAPRTTVILSSCSTAARGADGVDPLSLAAEFALAGASSVIAAIWEIPDQRAAELFYQIHLRLRRGDSAAEAITHTQEWAIGSSDSALAIASMSLASIEASTVY